MNEQAKIPIPSFDDLKKNIDELLLIDKWDNYKIKSSPKKFEKRLHQLFSSKLGLFPQVLKFMKGKDFTFPFYRLRKETYNMNRVLISEYSYPPNKIIKSTQRANIPYHPVFYCADNPMTAILETVRDEKEINPKTNYYLSEWKLKPDIDYRVTPFLFGNLDASSPFKSMSDDNFKKIEKMLEGYEREEIESFKKIMHFLSHLFVYDNSYVISSFIAHSHLYAPHNYRTDIFIYPSHQTERKHVNFAIHPNVVTEKMQLKSVYKMNIEKLNLDEGFCTVKTTQIGKNNDSIIYWENVSETNGKHIMELKKLFNE
ncbi:RES family NAD+ phosphorylase [Maribellus maritimus]|uniref:RES family NAD+ phosphorylase n=1 Tax=Maribellus maritimus TaxID=2870838 RepID=UPI001EEA0906|nr:RES family NAD+ phosphorylase [Maribellus maritimus]MCG6189104.1 RES family NAD+ phosphorylase [Maribellus maritimus]